MFTSLKKMQGRIEIRPYFQKKPIYVLIFNQFLHYQISVGLNAKEIDAGL